MNEKTLVVTTFLEDHKAMDVIALDVSEVCSWTDVCVIATVTSQAHLMGMVQNLVPLMESLDIQLAKSYKKPDQSGWELIDGGDIIVHLMNKDMRDFYDLEKLWYRAKVISSGVHNKPTDGV